MELMKKIFDLQGKPVKTIVFSFLLTFFAMFLTFSTIKIITKIDAKKHTEIRTVVSGPEYRA